MYNINAALAPGLEVGADIPQFPATPHDLPLLNAHTCVSILRALNKKISAPLPKVRVLRMKVGKAIGVPTVF
ncbi:unnamed protein product [Calypogeia fissa]